MTDKSKSENSGQSRRPALEYRETKSLIPSTQNARTHSPEQIEKIKESIEHFGFLNPIIIDKAGTIVAGHGRHAAATALGIQHVPVILADHLTDTQRRAYMLADNRIADDAGYDEEILAAELRDLFREGFDLDLTGFEKDELDEFLNPGAELTDEDTVPKIPAIALSKPEETWLLGKHRLRCGDSTKPEDVEQLMAGEKASLFSTDPPYVVDYDGTNHPQSKTNKPAVANKDWSDTYKEQDIGGDGSEFYKKFITAALPFLNDDAAWYCWHASKRQAMLEAVWIELGAFVHQQLIWLKSRPVLTYSAYMCTHEPCLMGWKKGKKPNIKKDYEPGEWPRSVWEVPNSEIESTDHPTSKPVKLFSIPMEMHLKPGEIAYEPFSGSGSQIMAAEISKTRCFAMEFEPVFVDVAIRRWQEFTGQEAKRESDGITFNSLAPVKEAA